MKTVDFAVVLVQATPNPARVVEEMGRICYQSSHKMTEDSADAFVRMILARGHESVIEHVSASFRIVMDRGVSHEAVRHRIASFSQESTRFCNYAKESFGNCVQVIEPPWLHLGPAHDIWLPQMESAEKAYFALLATGEPPELARSVLPTCLKTELAVTANAREWRHFLRLRSSPKAHPQMRIVAGLLRTELVRWFPVAFEDDPK